MHDMQFTLSLTGDVRAEDIDASDAGIDAGDLLSSVSDNSDVEFDDAYVYSGSVTITARASLSNYEVAASDLEDFDANTALEQAIFPYGGGDVTDTTYEVVDSPDGFDEVTEAVGYDTDVAIRVFAILDRLGYSN